MPKVPTYGDSRVQQRPLPGVRVRSDVPRGAFQAPAPPDFSDAIQTVSRIRAEEQDKADQIAIVDAENKMAELETELLYNPQTGVLNRRGKDSFTAPEDVDVALNKTIGEIEAGLTNDRQRLSFRRMSSHRQVDIMRTVQRHVSGERTEYDNEVTQSFITNERNTAIANFNDQKRVGTAIERQRAAIADFGKRNGLPDEKIERLTTEAISKTHVGVINRMLANDQDMSASSYYANHKVEVSGADVADVENALQEGSLRGNSQREADRLTKTHDDRTSALEEAKKITDPKLRDEVYRRVNQEFDQRREIKRETQDNLYLRAVNIIDANPGKRARSVIPPHVWSQLELGHRNALENRADGDGEGSGEGNAGKWLQFIDLLPQDMAKMNQSEYETKYRQHLSKQHRNQADQIWASARDAVRNGKDYTKDVELSQTLNFNQRFSATVRTSGLVEANKTPSEYSKTQSESIAKLQLQASNEIQQIEQAKGKKLTGLEQQEIINRVVTSRVFIKRFGKDTETLPGLIEEDERKKAYVPWQKIPAEERSSIQRKMAARHTPITTSKLQRAYAAYLLNDIELYNSIINEK